MLKRILSLACCLSLTVGLFTYRPPEAKAIVTEASLATSVLWSFMQSAGITFNGTGMNSSSWAEAIEPYLRDFTEWKDSAAKSFWHWLGYDGASEFIKALSWSKITHPTTMPFPSVVIPPAAAKKMGEFTHWFAEKVGLASGGESKPVYSSSVRSFRTADGSTFTLGTSRSDSTVIPFDSTVTFPDGNCIFIGTWKGVDSDPYTYGGCRFLNSKGEPFGIVGSSSRLDSSFYAYKHCGLDVSFYWTVAPEKDGTLAVFTGRVCVKGDYNYMSPSSACSLETFQEFAGAVSSTTAGFATQPGALSPTYDDNGEKPTVVAYPNISGDLTSINDLLQQILDKLAANDLNSSASLEGEAAPDVPATDIGWKGTIEKIYQGIIDLPGRIAEAIKDLFVPHEGYAAEFVSGLTGAYQGRFGLLTYPFSVLGDFVGTVATLDEQEPILRWNDVKWRDHVVIAKGEYNLKSAIAGMEMQTVYQVYRTVASAALIVGFLHLCIRKLREVQSH